MSLTYTESIILASRSPRRQELLSQIGVSFELLDIDIDETPLANEEPQSYVNRMAQQKARAGWQHHLTLELTKNYPRALLAADTSVVLGNNILGKPINIADAFATLQRLSGRTHHVITSVALVNAQNFWLETSVTEVQFALLTDSEIENYCASGESIGKAGSYAIQGKAAQFVKSIKGSYSGVVGLPLYETRLLLNKHFKAE